MNRPQGENKMRSHPLYATAIAIWKQQLRETRGLSGEELDEYATFNADECDIEAFVEVNS
jgi:hypothetical protein